MVIFLILILSAFIRCQSPSPFSVSEYHYEFMDFYIQCSVAIPSLVILMLKLSNIFLIRALHASSYVLWIYPPQSLSLACFLAQKMFQAHFVISSPKVWSQSLF